MKKNILLWALATLTSLAALVLAISMVFPGDRRDVITALPKPHDGSTYLLFSGKGEAIPAALADGLMMTPEVMSSCRSAGIVPMLRLIPRSLKAAVLIEISRGKADLYGAFSFHRGILGSLLEGSIPGSFASIFDYPSLRTVWADDISCLRLSSRCMDRPLYVHVDGGIALFASSPSGLGSMKESLLMRKESPPSRWGVEPHWDNHFKVSIMDDENLVSWDLENRDRWEFQAALRRDGAKSGALAWRIEGMDSVSGEVLPRRWSPLPHLPSPLESVIAVSDANILKPLIPLSWNGPVIFAWGGNGSALSLLFPGFLLVLPESGGADLTGSLWDDVSSDFALKPLLSDKYPEGFFSESPISVIFCRSDDISLAGILASQDLGPPVSRDLDRLIPRGWEESLLWGYVNGPYLAQGLEALVKVGRMVFRDKGSGLPALETMDSLVALTRQMRKVRRWSFAVPKISEGILCWN